MRDDYICRQKRKIKKILWDHFLIRYFLVFAIGLLSFMLLFAFDPPPEAWGHEDITVVDMQYRDRPIYLSRERNPGFKVIDQNGKKYWIDEDENMLMVGENYAVTYVNGIFYRFFRSVNRDEHVLMDYEKAVRKWEREIPIGVAIFIIFILCFLITVRYTIRYIRGVQQDAEFRQCIEKIKKYQNKQKNEGTRCGKALEGLLKRYF